MEPTAKLSGGFGVTVIEDNVGVVVDVDVDEQSDMTRVKTAINPIVKQ